MVSSLVGLSDMVDSIVELSGMDFSSWCSTSWQLSGSVFSIVTLSGSGLPSIVFSLVGRSDVVMSIVELSATHSNCFLYRGTRWQCILNNSTLGNGIPGMVSSLVGLTDMVVSIV